MTGDHRNIPTSKHTQIHKVAYGQTGYPAVRKPQRTRHD